MPFALLICPVVAYSIPDPETGTVDVGRAPKAQLLAEPGRGKPYTCSSAIAAGDWCLTLVRARDFTVINDDPDIINLFEGTLSEARAFLDETPRTLGWNAARMNRIRQRAEAKGVDTTGLTMGSTIEQILDRVCQAVAPYFRARGMRV